MPTRVSAFYIILPTRNQQIYIDHVHEITLTINFNEECKLAYRYPLYVSFANNTPILNTQVNAGPYLDPFESLDIA